MLIHADTGMCISHMHCAYSRGGGPARCRGFGTCGWEVVGRTWTRRPPIPYRVVVRREGSGSPTRRAPRSAFGAKGRLGYRQGYDVSLYPTTKGSTCGLDTNPTSPGLLLPATLDSSCSTYLTAPGWPSCVRIAGCRARAHTRVERLGGLGAGCALTPTPWPHGPPAGCLFSSWTRKLDGPAGRGIRLLQPLV